MKKRFSVLKNEKGLTLIELLAVVVVLAIIAAIAIPAIGSIIAKQEDKAVLANASMILAGAKLAEVNGECTGGTCDATTLGTYVDGGIVKTGDAAAKVGDVWTVTYGGLNRVWKLKHDKLSDNMTKIDEQDLLSAMGKN